MAEDQPLPQPPAVPHTTAESYGHMLNSIIGGEKHRQKPGTGLLAALRATGFEEDKILDIMRDAARNAYKKSVESGILAELGGVFSEDVFSGVSVEYGRMLRDNIRSAQHYKARKARRVDAAPY